MYEQFFGLAQPPFSIAPDPRYLFMSERHREALAHLLYGLGGGGGFVLLSGEIGAGKTTVCRCFLEQVPADCNVAYIFNPKLTVTELLKSVCDEFRIECTHPGSGEATVKDYVDALNTFLLRAHSAGRNNVLIIDEAQNLSPDVLEQLRLLTNLETNERKLLQIILIGQPELRTMLARPELEQLAQRVIARFHLGTLSEAETAQYIRHRLAVAGMTRALPFDAKAMRRIHHLSRGVPRRINLLCDRALLGAYAGGQPRIDRRVIDKAAGEVFDLPSSSVHKASRQTRAARLGLALAGSAALFGVVVWALQYDARRDSSMAAALLAGTASSPASSAASASLPASVSASKTLPASASSAATAAPALARAPDDAAPALAPVAGFKSLIRDQDDAWRALAPAWQLSLGEGDPCASAQRQQVHCFRSDSGLWLLRRLNRPAILTLRDPANAQGYALLTGLTRQQASLRIGDETRTLPLTELATVWRGEFATLWRAPPGYTGLIAEAAPGAGTDWVAARLNVLPADPAASAPGTEPLSLTARIRAFQTTQGLLADGLAGPITLMQLNRASGVDEPRLPTER